jgi:hypothetical protein
LKNYFVRNGGCTRLIDRFTTKGAISFFLIYLFFKILDPSDSITDDENILVVMASIMFGEGKGGSP